jgi:hypothetical protein
MARGAEIFFGALSVSGSLERLFRDAPCLAASSRRVFIMTMSQYEERFRQSAPSLHQTFAATIGRRHKRRRRRIWVAAALAGVLAITCSVASHRTLHSATGSHHRTTAAQGQRLVWPAQRNSDFFSEGSRAAVLSRPDRAAGFAAYPAAIGKFLMLEPTETTTHRGSNYGGRGSCATGIAARHLSMNCCATAQCSFSCGVIA